MKRKLLPVILIFLLLSHSSVEAKERFPRLRQRLKERAVTADRAPEERPGQNIGISKAVTSSGSKIVIWYPTESPARAYYYGTRGTTSTLAENAPVTPGKRFPLIIFSHGFHGCAVQSVFLTEALARAGYVVAAADHQDASCGSSGEGLNGDFRPQAKFRDAQSWSDATYVDRKDDIKELLDHVLASPDFAPSIDKGKIALAGHSLGGYTVLGVAGGWDSWKDERIRAVLALSPAGHPFLIDERIKGVDIPVMYQGGDRDIFLTPMMNKEGGLYDLSDAPKYFLQLKRQGHFAWSNLSCARIKSVSRCVAMKEHLQRINEFSIAFFDQYLKGEESPILRQGSDDFSDYRFEE